jgi:hypothetical protein
MIAIGEDRQTIYLTRGDTTSEFFRLAFYYPIYNFTTKQEEKYKFKLTDKISFVVKTKKGYTKAEVLRIEKTLAEMGYTEPTEYPEIILTEEDTKAFNLLDKKKTYWYDIVLNDTTTILGYDEDGAKKLIVYPEADEV